MKAQDFLKAGLSHMQDRAATYDKPTGERSMSATVGAFKCVTGVEMTEEQGWLFMGILKMVRSQQGEFKADNYEDEAAYAALRGECAFAARATVKQSLTVEIDPDGWIKWDGGERPVEEGLLVDIEDRSGERWIAQCPVNECDWRRAESGRLLNSDIIAYRIHKAGE